MKIIDIITSRLLLIFPEFPENLGLQRYIRTSDAICAYLLLICTGFRRLEDLRTISEEKNRLKIVAQHNERHVLPHGVYIAIEEKHFIFFPVL